MPQTTTARPATRTRAGRKPAPRPEQLVDLDGPVPAGETPLDVTEDSVPIEPAIAEQLAKEQAKLEREEKSAANRRARIEALKQGKLPAATSGLPPVVKMNALGALARQLHRAAELVCSPETMALDADAECCRAADTVIALRNTAMTKWLAQFEQRRDAGAADNDTLAPLGLEFDEDGKVRMLEKPKATKA